VNSNSSYGEPDANTDLNQFDVGMALFGSLETDLIDILDPDSFESEIEIDDKGQFLAWLEAEARVGSQPLPSLDEIGAMMPTPTDLFAPAQRGNSFGTSEPSPRRSSFGVDGLNSKLNLESSRLEESTEAPASALGPAGSTRDPLDAVLNTKTSAKKPTDAFGFDELPFADIEAMLNAATANLAPVENPIAQVAPEATNKRIQTETPKPTARVKRDPMGTDFGGQGESNKVLAEKQFVPWDEAETPSSSESSEPVISDTAISESAKLEQQITETLNTQTPSGKLEIPKPNQTIQPSVSSTMMMPATTTLRRYFDATDLLDAQAKLFEILAMPQVPLMVFLGRAAERCSSELPNVNSIALAELGDEGLRNVCRINPHESFRRVLMEINQAADLSEVDLTVADISDLELDEVVLPVIGTHLLLTRLVAHPEKPGHIRGTLALSGAVGLRSGANFLKAVAIRLESPITLMV
jgi:hypothetical protein